MAALADAPASFAAGRDSVAVCALPISAAVRSVAAGFPIPCFCSSINTRFFSASSCCRLDGRGCDAGRAGAACAPTAADGSTAVMLPGIDGATASLAEAGPGWIAPLHTCGPLAPVDGEAGWLPLSLIHI